MAAYYTYLVASLPVLNFTAGPPFHVEEFLVKCQDLISVKETIILSEILGEADLLDRQASGTLKRWNDFEASLRNELVRLRAARKKVDAERFLHQPDFRETQTSHVAMAAYRSLSILEAERILDQERWNFLDSLCFGHYFDFDFLIIYALKLKILLRWDRVQKADKEKLFSGIVQN